MILQPKTNHFAWNKEEVIVQLNGIGPWGVTYVNPADDPRKKVDWQRVQSASRSSASSRRSAFPRWLTACFSWGSSSAAVRPRSGRRKYGS